ncbi:MAG TPA: beta-glucuronidase, partial [Burkholderiaceae bacterium]
MKKLLLALAFIASANPSANADDLRPPLLLTAAQSRAGSQDLSGSWTYSKDLYRTGLTDINGWVAKSRMQRYRDVDVAAAEARGGTAFFEYDLDRGPVMEIPGAWNSAKPELRYYDGLIWFQRRFDAKPNPAQPGQRSFLRFEAVNYRAYVYLNGKEIGRHEGGFTPFVLEVTEALRERSNRLVVGVDSKHDGQSIPGEITDWDLYGGITRPVRLLHTPATFIDDATLRLTEAGRLVGSLQLNGPQAAGQSVILQIKALNLRIQATTDAKGEARFDVPTPSTLKRWSPESPTLYEVEFSSDTDRVQDRIGLRTIAVKGSQILLN